MFKRKKRHQQHEEFELNIVPVVDVMTIIITFMLASGVYYSFALLDIQVSAGGTQAIAAEKAQVAITLEIKNDKTLKLRVAGQENRNETVQIDTLEKSLNELKTNYPSVKSVTLISQKEVAYQDVIKAMEVPKRTHPEVLLGGF